MAIAWPVGVPHAFIHDTFERTPEDVVRRDEVAAGPPLRSLWAASQAQTVAGELIFNETQYAAFEAWRKVTLDYSNEAFDLTLYDHSAPRTLTARLRSAPVVRASTAKGRRVRMEARVDPPAPSGAALSALAGLHRAAPASWPVGVPGCPRVDEYESTAADQVARADDRNSPGSVLISRLEGGRERVGLRLSSSELEIFETWFQGTAALGARDILFPVPGGTHTGCFSSGYQVRGANTGLDWNVSFERYLEARP